VSIHQKTIPANLAQNLRANRRSPLVWLSAAVLLLVPLLFALLPTTTLWTRLIAICLLAWWLPGMLLVRHWRLVALDLPTAGIYALALGICWLISIVLLLYWIPGPIHLWQLIGTYALGLFLLILFLPPSTPSIAKGERTPDQKQIVNNHSTFTTPPFKVWSWLGLLLILAALMRFPGLGYHELHVDEVYVLYRAQQAIAGGTEAEPDPLAIHTKGPGEITMAIPIYRALGTANEVTGRFAYALASVGSVLALALLGWRIFSFPVGIWAGILLAVNGFALGLSRIVQYQGVILLLSVTTALAAWEFAQRGDRNRLALAAILSAFGIVMHYEFTLMAPLLLVLVWQGWRRNRETQQPSIWPAFFLSGIAGTILLAITYGPFFLNPHFEATQGYLGNRIGSSINFNLPFFVEMGTFYNSIYYFVGLFGLMLAGLFVGRFSANNERKRNTRWLLLLWFLPYFILYIFIMIFPGTHFYQFMLSWSLLAALPIAYVTQNERIAVGVRAAIVALIIGWIALSANYLRLMFFQQQPEYVTNYQKIRNPIYWAPYGEQIPQKPRFGFPIARGWKALGTLASWGYLGDTYATNDRSGYLRRWYLTEIERVPLSQEPETVFITRPPQQADLAFDDDLMEGRYVRTGEVRINGKARIEIWSLNPLPVPYVTFDAEQFESVFEQQVTRLEDVQSDNVMRPVATFADWLTLEAQVLDESEIHAGEALYLHLNWRPEIQPTIDYKLFIHIADETGRPSAQWDGFPGMNLVRTTEWTAGETFADHVLVPIPAEMPAGAYQVLLGLYDPATGERVSGEAFKVGEVRVQD